MSEDQKTVVSRDLGASVGPAFFEQDGVTMFRFVLDSANIIGPRKATKADKAEHAGAWDAFNVGRLPQLDHDGDNRPGGSKPAEEPVKRGPRRPPKPKE